MQQETGMQHKKARLLRAALRQGVAFWRWHGYTRGRREKTHAHRIRGLLPPCATSLLPGAAQSHKTAISGRAHNGAYLMEERTMTIDVYAQYFSAECTYNGTERRAAIVSLTSDSEQGHITYTASASFFPHKSDDDFAVSYDACVSQVLYEGKGRRSKKKEAAFLAELHPVIDALAAKLGARVHWDKALREARLG